MNHGEFEKALFNTMQAKPISKPILFFIRAVNESSGKGLLTIFSSVKMLHKVFRQSREAPKIFPIIY